MKDILKGILIGLGLVVGVVSGLVSILGALDASGVAQIDWTAIINLIESVDDVVVAIESVSEDVEVFREVAEKYLAD